MCAWHLLDPAARAALRDALEQSTTSSGCAAPRGPSPQAIGLVWYYRESNPVMGDLGRSTMDRLLTDAEIVGLARMPRDPMASAG